MEGRDATRFKQRLASRGGNEQGCRNVSSDVADYFLWKLDKG
jgi:hypothetical protein